MIFNFPCYMVSTNRATVEFVAVIKEDSIYKLMDVVSQKLYPGEYSSNQEAEDAILGVVDGIKCVEICVTQNIICIRGDDLYVKV